MDSSVFLIPEMDCPAEEQMVRMKLDEIKGVHQLRFDLPNRILEVHHYGAVSIIADALSDLPLDSKLLSNNAGKPDLLQSEHTERKLLILVLVINGAFFLLEIVAGFLANSMGLVADSLDMLADALVYGLSRDLCLQKWT